MELGAEEGGGEERGDWGFEIGDWEGKLVLRGFAGCLGAGVQSALRGGGGGLAGEVPASADGHLRQPGVRGAPAEPGEVLRPRGEARAGLDPDRLGAAGVERFRGDRGVGLSQRPLRDAGGCGVSHQRHPGAGDGVQERDEG